MFNFLKRKNTTVLPWIGKEPIYSYIKKGLDSKGKLCADFEELPDSVEFHEDKPLRWVSGAMDAIMGHHAASEKENVLMVGAKFILLRD